MIINLIATPRNISTALMYSFAQRSDTQVVDEPFYAYYLLETGAEHPGREESIQCMESHYPQIIQNIEAEGKKEKHYFVKNMAHHLLDPDWSFMQNWVNVFLIRNPKQLIASFAQVIKAPTMRDIGLENQYKIWQFLRAQTGQPPLVLDSNELLKNPPRVLQKLCEQIGIPFEEAMLSWEAGPIPEDGTWAKYWYQNVHQSTGFAKQKSSERPLPLNCQTLYVKARNYYEKLVPYRIKAAAAE